MLDVVRVSLMMYQSIYSTVAVWEIDAWANVIVHWSLMIYGVRKDNMMHRYIFS